MGDVTFGPVTTSPAAVTLRAMALPMLDFDPRKVDPTRVPVAAVTSGRVPDVFAQSLHETQCGSLGWFMAC